MLFLNGLELSEGDHGRRFHARAREFLAASQEEEEEEGEEAEAGVWRRAWVAHRLFATCEFVVLPTRLDGTTPDDTAGESTHRLDTEGCAWRRLPCWPARAD